nr:hypothetical protein MarQu_080 [Marseillevirus sp.]
MLLPLLVIVVLAALFTAIYCKKSLIGTIKQPNIWQLRMVKVKSPDPSLPIKYGWWFQYQAERNIPVSFIFEKQDGSLIYKFSSGLPIADKGSFLSNVDVPHMNAKIQDKDRNILWSGVIQL